MIRVVYASRLTCRARVGREKTNRRCAMYIRTILFVTSHSVGGRCIAISVSVCLFASQKPHVQISPNFLYMIRVAVALSSSDNSSIRYVLPVLWMTSFRVMGPMSHNQE